jgi:chlorobactene glucosyltransferase
MTAVVSALLFAVIVFLVARAVRQSATVKTLSPDDARSPERPPSVAVIIPARNEAANIRACVEGVLNQTYPDDRVEVVVIDDESTDGTADVVRDIAARNPRLSALRSPSLPPGWTGKGHACWVGVRHIAGEPDWLCFLDADVTPGDQLLQTAVAVAEADRLDLLSLAPRQILISFFERLILPCGFYVLAFSQDIAKTEQTGPDQAAATGMFMLVRRKVYEAAGGHRAVASVISEDSALALAVKRAGGKVSMRDGRKLLATRMYSDWRSLKTGIGKNLVDMLGGRAATIAASLLGCLLSWGVVVVPIACLITRPSGLLGEASLALAGSAALLAVAFHVAGAIHFRIPVWYGLLFPLGYSVGAFIAFDSVRQRMAGHVAWKGRSYTSTGPPSNTSPRG